MEKSRLADDSKPICVVIDTNIWRSELLLRTARGAALLYNLRQSKSLLGMPEVIEREIVKQAVAAGTESVEAIETNTRKLIALMGSGPATKVPTAQELKSNAQARLDEMRSIFISVPFTLEHAKSALDRVNTGLPPNGPKNQQYKDSTIWEAIIELVHTYRVHFLTNDKGFYKEFEKPSKGLADNLAEECRTIGGVVILHSDISSCLEHLQKHAAPLDQRELADAIESKLKTSALEKAAADRSYRLTGERTGVSISPFATEKMDTLALTFELTYQLADLSEDEIPSRLEPTLTAQGNCYYDQTTKEIRDIRLDAEIFRWKDINGTPFSNTNHYAYGFASITFGGQPTVAHTLRERVG